MNNYLKIILITFFSLFVFLFSSLFLSVCIQKRCEEYFYEKVAAIAISIPEEQTSILNALKSPASFDIESGKNILRRYGYTGRLSEGFTSLPFFPILFFSFLFAIGMFLFFFFKDNRIKKRIDDLTDYLKKAKSGIYLSRPWSREDIFSKLEDELYKTVVELRESRENALRERENLSHNLADISHQYKPPLTSLSLMGELLFERLPEGKEKSTVEQIILQIDRLNNLTASLLTLSRLDAGVLPLKRQLVECMELFSCARERIVPLLNAKNQSLSFYGAENLTLICDLNWTAEAIGNLLKNCCEHSNKGSAITVTAYQNPIFIGFIIEDEGTGFAFEDLPHLFERFYKGKSSTKESVGIGLSLSKSLIERQNGEIRAENRKEGGARFIIKFYKF